MRLTQNQKGFSIAEVLIGLSLVMFTSMALTQIMKDSANASNLSEARFEEQELLRQAQLHFTNKSVCSDNFKTHVMGTIPNTTDRGFADINSLKSFSGEPFAVKDELIGNRSLKVKDIVIRTPASDWSAFQSAKSSWVAGQTSAPLMASLEISIEKMKTTFGGKVTTRRIALNLVVDGSDRVVDCSTSVDVNNITSLTSACVQMGGSFNTATKTCEFTQACSATDPNKPVPARCLTDLNTKLSTTISDLQDQINKLKTQTTVTSSLPGVTTSSSTASASSIGGGSSTAFGNGTSSSLSVPAPAELQLPQ